MATPDGEAAPARSSGPSPPENSLIKALALAPAYRWRKLLEEGHYGTMRELAAAETIDQAYLGRVLQLTLLAPEIVEAIVEGRAEVTLAGLFEGLPVEWSGRRDARLRGHHADNTPAPGEAEKVVVEETGWGGRSLS